MAPLRRKTSTVLSALLLAAIAGGLAGSAYVVWQEPRAALTIAIVAAVGAAAVCRALDEFGWLFAALAVIVAVLGNGLYALHLLGVGLVAIYLAAGALVGLIFVILVRALIAAGSADYPYDE
ncbi:MAG TPA: hypothetical protein VIV11_00080 [Kofleriaceae bacterium]